MRKHIKVSIQKPNKLLMSDERRTSSGESRPPHPVGPEIPSFRALTNTLATEKTPQKTPPDRKQVSRGMNSLELLEFIHSRALISRVRKTFRRAPFLLPAEKPRHFFARRRRKGVKISAQIYASRAKFSRTILYSNNIKRTLATVFSKSVGLTPASFTILERDICSVQCCEDETFVKLFGTLLWNGESIWELFLCHSVG